MDISERLAKLLTHNKINANDLSKIINMQRSTLSHILSGRNKPSLELIERIHKAFPLLNLEWLISGTGTMEKSDSQNNSLNKTETIIEKPLINSQLSFEKEDVSYRKTPEEPKIIHSPDVVNNTEKKKVVKIILVYNDNSFEFLNNSQM